MSALNYNKDLDRKLITYLKQVINGIFRINTMNYSAIQ